MDGPREAAVSRDGGGGRLQLSSGPLSWLYDGPGGQEEEGGLGTGQDTEYFKYA